MDAESLAFVICQILLVVSYVNNMETNGALYKRFKRTKFLLNTIISSPMVVFVYSPLLVAQTIAGTAVPFATGRFIDSLVGGIAPVGPFVILATLLLARSVLAPCLQLFVFSRARTIELKLQKRVLDTVMNFAPAELSTLANGELVAKLTRDAYAIGGFVNGLYPRLLIAVVTMLAAGSALYSRSAVLGISFMAFIPLAIAMFFPFAKRFAANSHSVRKRSDDAFSSLFDFFHSLPFLSTLGAERRFADSPRHALTVLKDGNCAMDRLTVAFGALLGTILVVGEIIVLGVAGVFAAEGTIPVGDVVVYQLLFLAAMQSVQGIVSLLPETASLREGIDSLDEILSNPHERGRAGRSPLPDLHVMVGSRVPRDRVLHNAGRIESIEFRNVTYFYPGAEDRPVFRYSKIHCTIRAMSDLAYEAPVATNCLVFAHRMRVFYHIWGFGCRKNVPQKKSSDLPVDFSSQLCSRWWTAMTPAKESGQKHENMVKCTAWIFLRKTDSLMPLPNTGKGCTRLRRKSSIRFCSGG